MIQQKIEDLIRADAQALKQLQVVREFGPEGAHIAAGFIRNRVWDSFYPSVAVTEPSDVDVVYYCASDTSKEREEAYEAKLRSVVPSADWQVRNQARMHHYHGFSPFKSLEDGLRHWSETATSIGVRLNKSDRFEFIAPFGFGDLEQQILRITPAMKRTDPDGFLVRVQKKKWQQRWPNLTVITD